MFVSKMLRCRGLTKVPYPLWKLMITDAEFEELKSEIRRLLTRGEFYGYGADIVLFYAEWWRRDCTGQASKDGFISQYFPDLFVPQDVKSAFYQTARDEVKLHRFIPVITTSNNRSLYFRSMLYQGGLPLRAISSPKSGMMMWKNFLRGFIFKGRDIDLSALGEGAEQSDSLSEFCQCLLNATERSDDGEDNRGYMLMPFYCDNNQNPWYLFMIREVGDMRSEHAELNPFRISFQAEFNELTDKMSLQCTINGPKSRTFGSKFLEEHQLDGEQPIRVSYYVDSEQFFTVIMLHNYADQDLSLLVPYTADTDIVVKVNEKTIISRSLTLDSPVLFSKDTSGKTYSERCNIGSEKNKIIIPEGWQIEANLPVDKYSLGSDTCNVASIEGGCNNAIVLTDDSGTRKVFDRNTTEHSTQIDYDFRCYNKFLEKPLYKKRYTRVFKVTDGLPNNGNRQVLYQAMGGKEWVSEPPLGEIKVRPDDATYFYTPRKAYYPGENFSINCQADNKTAIYTINWPEGNVRVEHGTKTNDGRWKVNLADVGKGNKMFIYLTPKESGRQFKMELKRPFVQFAIYDPSGAEIEDDHVIPLVDLNMFKYHFHGGPTKDSITIKFDAYNRRCRYTWTEDGLKTIDVKSNRPWEQSDGLLYEDGSLSDLLFGEHRISNYIERNAENVKVGNFRVTVCPNSFKCFHFDIRRYPYRFKVIKGIIKVVLEIFSMDENGERQLEEAKEIPYKGELKFYSLSDYKLQHEPQTIERNEEGQYLMPTDRPDGEKILLFAATPGRILPKMQIVDHDVTQEERDKNKEQLPVLMQAMLDDAFMGDTWQETYTWFRRATKHSIPYSSLFHLTNVGANPKLLVRFLSILFMRTYSTEDKDLLPSALIQMETDLSFQWIWLSEILQEGELESFLCKSQRFDDSLKVWEILTKSPNPKEGANEFFKDFMTFYKKLRNASKNNVKDEQGEVKKADLYKRIDDSVKKEEEIMDGKLDPWSLDKKEKAMIIYHYQTFHTYFAQSDKLRNKLEKI